MKTVIGINGAGGRMGQRLVALAQEDRELTIGAVFEFAGHPKIGQDVGEVAGVGKLGVPLRSDWPLDLRLEAMIDFSAPEGTMQVLPLCLQKKVPLVVATTGHTAAQKAEIEAAAHQPVQEVRRDLHQLPAVCRLRRGCQGNLRLCFRRHGIALPLLRQER